MPVLLNGESCDLSAPDLGSLLASAQNQVSAAGQMIVEVQFDGAALTSDQIDERINVPIVAVEVNLITATAGELAIEALDAIQEKLDLIRQIQADAADDLQADDQAAGYHKLSAVIDAWIESQGAFQGVAQILEVDLGAMDIDGTPMATIAAELVNQLSDLKDGVEAQDAITLADALAYEWPTHVDRWSGLVTALRGRVTKEGK